MDKNAIKKYAVWARRELIERVSQKALQYGIATDDKADSNADSVNGKILSAVEKKQRQALIRKIQEQGYEQVMEEVAYTWFNRFAALRFMEVNGYLPSHVRVFTNEDGEFKPQILSEAIHLELDDLDMDKVYELKNANKNEELFKYLLITQCNALSNILPGMFQKIEDYTELLLPDNLLREGSVIERLITEIPEDNFDVNSEDGQIEIIGWLYQYYIIEKHDQVINIANKGPIKKEDVPAATQLFTTDWVVRYIVDNSIGRYWIERHKNSELQKNLKFFVTPKDGKINYINTHCRPQDITVFDPCIGSGHFAVYSFEILLKIYLEYGYSDREAAALIIENNLYGLDIDERAVQLAYFSIMMKARQYDRRFFFKGIQPKIYSITESNNVSNYVLDYFCDNDASITEEIKKVLAVLKDAKEYGSILQMPEVDIDLLKKRINEIQVDISIWKEETLNTVVPLVRTVELMSKRYAVVVTNPPYHNKYDAKLKEYLNKKYKDYSGDLFSVFIYRNLLYANADGYVGFMTPFVWMFIKSYEKLREYIISNKSITTLAQLEYSAYEEATVPICTFVLQNCKSDRKGLCFKLSDFPGGMEVQKVKILEAIDNKNCGYFYETSVDNYLRITGNPIAFWASEEMLCAFEKNPTIAELAPPKQGLATANNDRFLRLWFEPQIARIGFGITSCENAKNSGFKWFPYNKGGAFRRWYGNRDYVVDWENDGYEIKNFRDENGKVRSRPQNLSYYFKEGITWSDITSASFSGRYSDPGFMFDIKGSSGFPSHENLYYILGFLNSSISQKCIKILNPTITTQVGDMARIPVAFNPEVKNRIDTLVKQNIEIAKKDWDAFETSWDFVKHPLVRKCKYIKDAFNFWTQECEERFSSLKRNEEEINSIFIDIYGLSGEMTASVSKKDVEASCHHADKNRDIKSLISYAVGCMFGRYSLDVPGLAYAGGEWDTSKYLTFQPDKYAIIPICDDEYFEDDIVGRFTRFIEVVYGSEALEDNLRFIADSLGGKGNSREVLRDYFINTFYSDHCNNYAVSGSGKRPIYWLFDSGKKNGFKCLIYMHRYQPDTIARIRTDYVHEQQSRYRTAIADLEQRINGASTSERVKLNKKLSTLRAQADEIRVYEEKIHHLADQMIRIDLDDGVKNNYEIFKDVLAKIK